MTFPDDGHLRFDPRPGAKLWVEWRGTWWKATLLHEVGQGVYRIHYDGWSSWYDENVGPSRMVSRDRRPPGARGGLGVIVPIWIALLLLGAAVVTFSVGVSSRPGHEIASTSALAVGTPIWIAWGSTWYEGSVLQIDGDRVRVHYDGWPDSDDETVTLDRVRTR